MKKALAFIGGTLIGTLIGVPVGVFLVAALSEAEGGCKIKDGNVIWGDPDKREEESDKEE